MGIMPALDLPKMIAGMMGATDRPLVGWLVRFMIGVVGYGIVMALVSREGSSGGPMGHALPRSDG